MHTVMQRKKEVERKRTGAFTSPLCMQSSSSWHLPKCKGVFPSPSLWFGSAPWSRSSCTANKEKRHISLSPFAPQVRPMWATAADGSHKAALRLLLFSSLASAQTQEARVCVGVQQDPVQSQAVPLPLGILRGNMKLRTPFLLHQYRPGAGNSCLPFSRDKPGSKGPPGNFATEHPENSNLCHVLNQNKEHPSQSLPQRGCKTTPTHQCDHCHCRRRSAGLSAPCHPQHRDHFHPPGAAGLTAPRKRGKWVS